MDSIRAGKRLPHGYGHEVYGNHLRPYLIGDAAFALEEYMMKTYANPSEPWMWSFNYVHIRARRHIECVFGRLCARWQILKSRKVLDLKMMNSVITVCCALHNICQKAK